eukprot:scaffold42300_cov55-Phaeocystis_antarctica.AAC.1
MATCARAAAAYEGCGTAIMWSNSYSYDWGCMCCAPTPSTSAHKYWGVYDFEIMVPPPSPPPPSPPPPSPLPPSPSAPPPSPSPAPPSPSSPPPICGCSAELEAMPHELEDELEAELEAKLEAIR